MPVIIKSLRAFLEEMERLPRRFLQSPAFWRRVNPIRLNPRKLKRHAVALLESKGRILDLVLLRSENFGNRLIITPINFY